MIFLTGVRDYIHVVDLAQGHVAALKKIDENCGCKVVKSVFCCFYIYMVFTVNCFMQKA